jgi:hypothetical protein
VRHWLKTRWKAVIAASALVLGCAAAINLHAEPHGTRSDDRNKPDIQHVLLISIDGMHALDFINGPRGISGVNGGEPYCQNLSELADNGVNYLDTSTSKPSDSFPRPDGHRFGRFSPHGGRVLRRRLRPPVGTATLMTE